MVRKSRSLALVQLRRDSRCICPLRAPASTSFPVFRFFPDFPDFAATPQLSVHPRETARRRLERPTKTAAAPGSAADSQFFIVPDVYPISVTMSRIILPVWL